MDTALIALNPGEMTLAQNNLVAWVNNKLEEVHSEMRSAQGMLKATEAAGMDIGRPRHLVNATKHRIFFYEKVKAALDAGYYIIPPFPVQAFAVGSAQSLPPARRVVSGWQGDHEVKGEVLPVGQGNYFNAEAKREVIGSTECKNKQGETYEQDVWENTAWRDVVFPFRAVRPEVIEAVGCALKRRIFDILGVLPTYRTSDPMVVGIIKNPSKGARSLTFFVAWWLDTRDL